MHVRAASVECTVQHDRAQPPPPGGGICGLLPPPKRPNPDRWRPPPHRSLSARLVRAWGASCGHLQPEYYDRVLSLSKKQRCLLRPGPDPDPWT
eukprot:scaffold22267_cov64-Phaeocystis_antarctica.AAC.2